MASTRVLAVDMESGAHALALGAREFIPQPDPGGEGMDAHGEFGAEIATEIRSLVASARHQACGPNTLQAVLRQLQADLPALGRRPLPLGGPGLRRRLACGRADRHGARRKEGGA